MATLRRTGLGKAHVAEQDPNAQRFPASFKRR
jgi:hypothetical protein